MRILHVLDHSLPIHSGYSYRTLEILKQQRALGWETIHLTSLKQGDVSAPLERAADLDFHRTTVGNRFLETNALLNPIMIVRSLEKRLAQLIATGRPNVLHAHSPCLTGIAAVRAARRAGLPVVYEIRALWEDGAVDHGTTTPGSLRYQLTRAMESWVLRRAHQVTTICEGLRKEILARGIPAQDVTVIPNGVDPNTFSVMRSRDLMLARELGFDGKRVVGFIGSFYGYEGLTILMQAMPFLLAKDPSVRLLLVGGGQQVEALHREAESLGVVDKVVFTGWVDHDQIHRYYSLMDVLVYPRLSTRVTELVTPLKPLEAMAQGRLVVASDIGGHRELIRHGDTGLLFRAGDPQALTAAVLDLLQDSGRAANLRVSGRRYVESERTWRASVDRYAGVYERAVSRASFTQRLLPI